MTRDELTFLVRNIILFKFSTKQFCIAKFSCYADPCTVNMVQEIKTDILTHATFTSVTDIPVFVASLGQNFLLPYCIH
jgi:hypothetical protein